MNDRQRYVADIQPVAEVIVTGRAELAFWQARLQSAQLLPTNLHGYAHVLISATSARWHGVPFKEWSVSIGVGEAGADGLPPAYYLAHAVNSRALFAWSERTFFHTPYFPGDIEVQAMRPVGVQLRLNAALSFEAVMADRATAGPISDEHWRGPIYLPARSRRAPDAGEFFSAVLEGPTEVYPFEAARDRLSIKATPRAAVFDWLLQSAFTPLTWRVRRAAHHAKAATRRREGGAAHGTIAP